MTPVGFVEAVRSLSFRDTFNPYSDRCAVHDCADAPRRRCDALLAVLEVAAKSEVDSIWIGRDLGYRGGRRTGLAFTDDVNLFSHADRWGVSVKRSTKGRPVAERTARIIWEILNQIEAVVFLWNIFPLHPHKPSCPFTNRMHNARERRAGEVLLHQLVLLLRPRRLVAIGNDAASTACRVFRHNKVAQIRHPSYGGRSQFVEQTRELYGMRIGGRLDARKNNYEMGL